MADERGDGEFGKGHLNGRRIEIPEDRYSADMALHDRFVSFSSEMMKLAIGGIVAVGFILTLLAGKGALPPIVYSPAFATAAIASVSFFVLSAGSSLVHRFLAADGIYHHLRAIKHLILAEEPDATAQIPARDVAAVRAEAESDECNRNRKFGLSERWLLLSGGLLFAGLASFVSAIIFILRNS